MLLKNRPPPLPKCNPGYGPDGEQAYCDCIDCIHKQSLTIVIRRAISTYILMFIATHYKKFN